MQINPSKQQVIRTGALHQSVSYPRFADDMNTLNLKGRPACTLAIPTLPKFAVHISCSMKRGSRGSFEREK